jgi:hypothetical protein
MTCKRSGPPGYRNLFTLERNGKAPLILLDGTSVEFPADWSKKDAETWREQTGLPKPKRSKGLTRL